jgi:hypothetical protein
MPRLTPKRNKKEEKEGGGRRKKEKMTAPSTKSRCQKGWASETNEHTNTTRRCTQREAKRKDCATKPCTKTLT